MSSYLAILGSTPDLSFAELQSVVGASVERLGTFVARLELTDDSAARAQMDVLGGTVKILRQLDAAQSTDHDAVLQQAVSLLSEIATQQNDSIDFAISELGRDHLPVIEASEIKMQLKAAGLKARYVEGSRRGLNAASLKSNHAIVELTIVQTAQDVLYGVTVGVQDVDDWALRDRQKPFAQHKRGLLPPKVARMMVNLALGNQPQAGTPLLCDPFCGSGSVLFEAMLRGCNVVGGDIETEAVQGTKENLAWFRQAYPQLPAVESAVVLADAAHLSLPAGAVTHLVTEPFLGKPKPRPEQLPNIYRGLERMYLGSFKHWRSFLAEKAAVVVVFPVVDLVQGEHTRRYSLESLIDKLADFGYTTTSEPIMYGRPDAIVQRAIYRFTYVTR